MPRLTTATTAQIDAIYRESHTLWGAGLSLRAYRAFWDDVAATPWAREHVTYLVWEHEDGGLLSSLKLYRPWARHDGRRVRITGIGALFTPRALRGQGHASALLNAVMVLGRRRGDALALLFTDIGVGFYRRLGFVELDAEEAWGRLPRSAPEDDWSLRPMRPGDLARVRRLHARRTGPSTLNIVRDGPYWDYLVARSRQFFRRLDGSDLSQRFRVAFKADRFAGYVIAAESGEVWVVREVEAVDDDPAARAALLRAAGREAQRRGLRRIYGWLPRALASRLPEWRLVVRKRRRARPMAAPLGRAVHLRTLEQAGRHGITYLDQF